MVAIGAVLCKAGGRRFDTLAEARPRPNTSASNNVRYEIADFQDSTTLQRHVGDSYGYRIKRDGKGVVYSTDSEPRPGAG